MFLYLLEYFGIFKSTKGIENPEIMNMLGFGLSNNKIEKLLDQIEAA